MYDAYPIAQRHCSRWGFFASPSSNWSISASSSRYLDYTCVRRRPHLAYPHYRRGHYGVGRRGIYRRHNRRPNYPRRRVITPKPLPRVKAPIRRRGTFGRVFNPAPVKRRTVVERGKPWEHNKRKQGVVTRPLRKKVVVERGKPWEHNINKGSVKRHYKSAKTVSKRSTFRGSRPKIIKETRVNKKRVTKYKPSKRFGSKPLIGRKYGNLKSKRGSSRRGILSL